MRFVDTNVLLYAVSTAEDEAPEAEVAIELLQSKDLGLSVQVLQEFYVQATRVTKEDRLTHDQASALVESFLRFHVQETTVAIMKAAMATREKFRISYWDAAVIEASRALSCEELLSKDMSDGQNFDGVVVRNPFRGVGEQHSD